jgi:hypothetical protein
VATSKELKALIVLAGKIDPSLQSAMLKATGQSQKLSANLQKSASGLNKVMTIAKGTFLGAMAARGVAAVGRAVAGLASGSIDLASDLTEVQNVVDVTFGTSSKAIDIWAKTALKSYGLSTLQAKQYSGTMGALLKSSGVADKELVSMSQNLAGLAGDMASFYNLDHDLAFEKIRSGISGETEPLKQLGINMSVANLEAFALSKGIKTSYNAMDQASKTTLRYEYLLSVAKDTQGDFARTLDESYANQRRLFNTTMQQKAAEIAQKALPLLTKFYARMNEFAMSIDTEKVAQSLSVAFETLGNAIQWAQHNADWLIPVLVGTTGALAAFSIINRVKAFIGAWTVVTKAQTIAQAGLNTTLTLSPIGAFALALGVAIAAGVAIYRNWDEIRAAALRLWESINKLLGPVREFFSLGNKSIELSATTTNVKGSKIPMFAGGGFASRPSIFGDDGLEAAIPIRRTPRSLALLEQTARMLGVNMGGNVTFNVSVNVNAQGGDEQKVAAVAGEAVEEVVAGIIEKYFGDKERVAYGY